ncbi:universal stress protein [Candidatus Venteria ishoeyi]|uniref:Putative universal stress protein n=1 Tax=Candidatus Venteria ishoeyi TaxID=1899563 RepID=A0A1H6FD11_9GAMM|nr:universal stress protein [Candidatus Venteria ishoeyi]SEH07281.1 Putative universal stress protein [Candidatus Venteria ishoeyi]
MTQTQANISTDAAAEPLPEYASILLAADSSDHANQGIQDTLEIAKLWQGEITGTHVYAAKMHDMRFRQMEGGLPEQFRQEEELERQRDVHDDLISRGLSIITDSYLDQVDQLSQEQALKFKRRSLEGKNYRELAKEANQGTYDLLVMGALGLGAIKGSLIGTVCERVARRSDIDTLIIKTPQQSIQQGPIVVAVDGSEKSYGGLLRGIAFAKQWAVPLHVISAFDPYYHYVAFNRIADVLSEEAGKVFRFQEQEQLHEEIIDSGLAKIYDGHLSVAKTIANDYDIEITTQLLDGKPWDAILKYVNKINPSLLILGKTGIHADDALDIGGNTENLLRLAPCSLLLSQKKYIPQIERLADVTTSWTLEAEQRMKNVPSFVQNMARAAILRYAQERGHTVITESIMEEATRQLMPKNAEQVMQEIVTAHDAGELKKTVTQQPMQWTAAAKELLNTIKDESLRSNLALRAEKKARAENTYCVDTAHLAAFLETEPAPLHWQAAALARLARVPEGFMRDMSKQRIEDYAKTQQAEEITLELAEAGLAQSRQVMADMEQAQQPKKASVCPFAKMARAKADKAVSQPWTEEAKQRLLSVPAGYCRDMTLKAAESIAQKSNINMIDADFIQGVMATFTEGSEKAQETLSWDEAARQRITKAPDMVRGMLIQEIETWAKEQGLAHVDTSAVDEIKRRWQDKGVFHMGADDPRNA